MCLTLPASREPPAAFAFGHQVAHRQDRARAAVGFGPVLDEPSAFYMRGMAGGRRDAVDGVRFALWDNRQAVKPSAMTLIALTELQAASAAMK